MLNHLLLPGLAPSGRIVNDASAPHYGADLNLHDLDFGRRRYLPSAAYAQSKFAIAADTSARLGTPLPHQAPDGLARPAESAH